MCQGGAGEAPPNPPRKGAGRVWVRPRQGPGSLAVQTGRVEVPTVSSQVASGLRRDRLLPACPLRPVGPGRRERGGGLPQGAAPLECPRQGRGARVGPTARSHPRQQLPQRWGGREGEGGDGHRLWSGPDAGRWPATPPRLLRLHLGLPDGFRRIPQPPSLPPSPPSMLHKEPPQRRGLWGAGSLRGQLAPLLHWPPRLRWVCCQLPSSHPDGRLVFTRGAGRSWRRPAAPEPASRTGRG